MSNEIYIDDVPLTPRGVNHNFAAVRKYEFVRYDEDIKFRTSVLISPDCDLSDNEVDIKSLKTVEEKVNAIIKSPMIEVRKKRKSLPSLTRDGTIRLNPTREDLRETSIGSLENYQQNRRKTIGVVENISSHLKPRKRKESIKLIPDNNVDDKENVTLDKELDLLVLSVTDSQVLLDNEKKRLSEMISDWNHIVKKEHNDIPPEIQGDIKSAIGRLQILLDKRFQSTLELLRLAETYVNNNGDKLNAGDRDYRYGDIYGFVDLLIEEIRKADVEFAKLLEIRNDNWVVKSEEAVPTTKRILNKPKTTMPNIKNVKSRIDVTHLRAKFRQNKNTDCSAVEEPAETCDIDSENYMISTSADLNEKSYMKKTPVSSVKKGIRSKAMLKSTTGTPVHSDTPRPRRSCSSRVSSTGFAKPSANIAVSKRPTRKRSAAPINDGDLAQSPVSMPKLPRKKRE